MKYLCTVEVSTLVFGPPCVRTTPQALYVLDVFSMFVCLFKLFLEELTLYILWCGISQGLKDYKHCNHF